MADPERRERATESAHEVVNRFWTVDYDDDLVANITDALLTFAAQEAQRATEAERERDYWTQAYADAPPPPPRTYAR